MDIVTDAEVAAYLETTVTAGLTLVVGLTNDLITEAWDPAQVSDPAPARVKALALNVAARAVANPKGLTSWTRAWDDITRTERMEGGDHRTGVYLTDDEVAELNGIDPTTYETGTISTPTREYVCPPDDGWVQC